MIRVMIVVVGWFVCLFVVVPVFETLLTDVTVSLSEEI